MLPDQWREPSSTPVEASIKVLIDFNSRTTKLCHFKGFFYGAYPVNKHHPLLSTGEPSTDLPTALCSPGMSPVFIKSRLFAYTGGEGTDSFPPHRRSPGGATGDLASNKGVVLALKVLRFSVLRHKPLTQPSSQSRS